MRTRPYKFSAALRLLFDLWQLALWVVLMRGWGDPSPRADAWYLGFLGFYVYAFVLSSLRRRGVLVWKTHPAEKVVTIVLSAALVLRMVWQWF